MLSATRNPLAPDVRDHFEAGSAAATGISLDPALSLEPGRAPTRPLRRSRIKDANLKPALLTCLFLLSVCAEAAHATIISISSELFVRANINSPVSQYDLSLDDAISDTQGTSLGNLSASAFVTDRQYSVFSASQASWNNASSGSVVLGVIGSTELGNDQNYIENVGYVRSARFEYTFTADAPGTITIDAAAWQPEGIDTYPNYSALASNSMLLDGVEFGKVGGNGQFGLTYGDQTAIGFPLLLYDESGQYGVSFTAGTHTLTIGGDSLSSTAHVYVSNGDTDTRYATFNFQIATVPEPNSALLTATGLLVLCWYRSRPGRTGSPEA